MEELQKDIGGCGRFQWMLVSSLKLGIVPISWSMLQMAFCGIVPDWWCLPSPDYHGNLSSSSSSSSIGNGDNWPRDNTTFQACDIPGSGGESCGGHMVFDESITTVVSEWSLVCERKYVKAIMTSAQMGGVFVGALVAGQTSDILGRRLTSYAALVWHLVTSLVAAFSVHWAMFLAMRVLIGVSLGAYLVASFPFCFEFVSTEHRQMVAFTPGWDIGVGVFVLAAWIMPHWSHLHIGAAVITVPILLTWFIVPESARWLATQGRLQEAERVVKRIARMNRRPAPAARTRRVLEHVARVEKEVGQGQGQGRGRRYTYLDIYRGWRMAGTTLICNFLWFSMSLSYYGISFGVSALSGSFYLNTFLMSFLEIPLRLIMSLVANRVGRRWPAFSLYSLCALFSFAILVVDKTVAEDQQGTVTTALAICSKLCLGSVWMIAATFTSELYPTVIRSLGYGASNMIARVGGVLAPVVMIMDSEKDVVRAYVIVGTVMTISGVLTLFLRETKGQGLQDSITVHEVAGEDGADIVKVTVAPRKGGAAAFEETELGVDTTMANGEIGKSRDEKRKNGEKMEERDDEGGKDAAEKKQGKAVEGRLGKDGDGDGDDGRAQVETDRCSEIFSIRL
ncbi:solute carrier family 22 member 7-like [Babylonia areolata]|uniref:solute carrier family 22 member 7-like n=1 Tax=Babylonia areolata TaxID=304850 RepID=UPI003FD3AC28